MCQRGKRHLHSGERTELIRLYASDVISLFSFHKSSALFLLTCAFENLYPSLTFLSCLFFISLFPFVFLIAIFLLFLIFISHYSFIFILISRHWFFLCWQYYAQLQISFSLKKMKAHLSKQQQIHEEVVKSRGWYSTHKTVRPEIRVCIHSFMWLWLGNNLPNTWIKKF